MDHLWNTVNANHSLIKLLQARERREDYGKRLRRNCQFTVSLLKRLDLAYKLEGHQGCVNCLEWSKDGRIIASGSDDTHVRIWDPFVNKCLNVVRTKHIGNIFSVKFVGDGSLIATGAADCRVTVQSIEDSERQAHVDCSCHVGRVKRLATTPDQPYVFWSAAEDGLIMQYDLREQHECMKNSTVFVDMSHTQLEFKCITVNPTKPHLIAVGANDSYVRLYDRRLVKTSIIKSYSFDRKKDKELQDPSCVTYFAPGHLAKDNGGLQSIKLAATYVAFDSTGNELLVNMGGEHIYLFNINNHRHTNELRIPECLPKVDRKSPIKSCCFTNIKKLKNVHKYNYKFNNNNPCACDYTDRALRMYKRKGIGDVYCAARDYLYVIQHWPNNEIAYSGLIDCLIYLEWPEEATNWIKYLQDNFPAYVDSRQSRKWEEALVNIQNNLKRNLEEIEIIEPVVSTEEKALRLSSMDYEQRYIGHSNITTDIKEANFLGEDGDFICAGSDDGVIFIWDKKTTNLLSALMGDVSIVNCVQPHPTVCCLASSGIDPVVKIWSPQNQERENYVNQYALQNPWLALEANQERMSMNPFEAMLVNMGYNHIRTSTPIDNRRISTCSPS